MSLKKKRILVTRPKHQADHLCKLISFNGGEAIAFPTIDIQPINESDESLVKSNAFSEYDFIIFISRNAVEIAFDRYLSLARLPAHIKIFAIGAGTADVLLARNIKNVIHAGVQADSKAFLNLSQMQKRRLKDKKVLIIRGIGGRQYLADNLKSRGASVDYAEVYKRCLPEQDVNNIYQEWQNTKLDAIVITSNEGLNNLVSLVSENDHSRLFNTPLVLMSIRNDNLAKELGFVSNTSIAINKSDEGLLLAILDLVGE